MERNGNGIRVECAHDKLVSVDSLIPNPRNPNRHPQSQIKLLSKIIKEQGWRNPIVVSNRSGFVTKGHARLEAAKALGIGKVPVDYQDYENEAKEWADMIADNRLAELAENDNIALAELLKDMEKLDIDVSLTGYEKSDILRDMGGIDLGDGEIEDKDPMDKYICLVPQTARAQAKIKLAQLATELGGVLIQ